MEKAKAIHDYEMETEDLEKDGQREDDSVMDELDAVIGGALL